MLWLLMTSFITERVDHKKINAAHLYPWPRKIASNHIKMEETGTGICLYWFYLVYLLDDLYVNSIKSWNLNYGKNTLNNWYELYEPSLWVSHWKY